MDTEYAKRREPLFFASISYDNYIGASVGSSPTIMLLSILFMKIILLVTVLFLIKV